ncbi:MULTISPECIES: class I SAM-dependent methyltransferase [unclassified Sphingomonas]|uniref:class I SAM-dependent methyltransferase n=1 Tax=unclassified Sphingomonas TaxID=196159 RepID=UPI000701C9D3|nr:MULTISPECIES: class I SAM-dependent methyltransferase [unclassified Sphingomonas]KQX25153.1 hypothetical protein ASD17_24135 [Sphingomonas sp. Root1294]KQY66170.1 hypothetical protein ASD39_13935 [Sphingomonas sp. Root50]KRB89666.1 hypothetical protein ASE22_18660 [Sphingomonas sp. Root720]
MRLSRSLARQLADPTGIAGTLCGAAMDLANRVPMQKAIDILAPLSGETVLDAGCGTGAASAEMLRRADCRIVAVDQSATMIHRARARLARRDRHGVVDLHRAKLESLPCRPGSIDAALALNILYFCEPDGGMIAALREALRPGGRLVCYVTDRHAMERWSFTRAGLHRLYDGNQLVAALAGGGFDPANITLDTRWVAPGVRGLFALAHAG